LGFQEALYVLFAGATRLIYPRLIGLVAWRLENKDWSFNQAFCNPIRVLLHETV